MLAQARVRMITFPLDLTSGRHSGMMLLAVRQSGCPQQNDVNLDLHSLQRCTLPP